MPLKPVNAAILLLLVMGRTAAAATGTDWRIDTNGPAASLVFGEAETARAFRFDCNGGTMRLSTWTSRLPRNITEGEFPARLSVFQGKREIVLGGKGRVLPAGGTHIEARVGNRQSFLERMGQNSRLVVVTFAGRSTAPAPDAELLGQFTEACLTR